jgi:alanine dehydrogenase
MATLILTQQDVASLLDMPAVIAAVEQAFRDLAAGKAGMPPKVYLNVADGDFRAMPAALPGAAGIKWVNVHPANPEQKLPTIMAVIIYSDPKTGYPLAVMDAGDITAYRTGATAAIAAKYLAKPNSSSLGLIGTGRQAASQLLAHSALFKLKEIRVYDKIEENAKHFQASFPGYPITIRPLEETAACDIVCTLTPSRKLFLTKSMVLPGTHINAVGADAPGKEELAPALLQAAAIVVDDVIQASHAGEINVPLKRKLISQRNISATLSEMVSGKKTVRKDEQQITVFDATGLAIEDIAVASLVYRKAATKGGYLKLDIV